MAHDPKPLSLLKAEAFDYQKLTDDVLEALEKGKEASDKSDDLGASNMDGVVLRLPRLNEEKVVQALAQADVTTSKQNCGWCGLGYMINPKTNGQGNKRMVASEAIYEHLRACGYSVSNFYMMD